MASPIGGEDGGDDGDGSVGGEASSWLHQDGENGNGSGTETGTEAAAKYPALT